MQNSGSRNRSWVAQTFASHPSAPARGALSEVEGQRVCGFYERRTADIADPAVCATLSEGSGGHSGLYSRPREQERDTRQSPIPDRLQGHDKEVRCGWAKTDLMIRYHDEEWGTPVHDDRRLFEFLILEGAQAGLSWETILKKRENYRTAFENFAASAVAQYCALLGPNTG
jgi:hypothetical protein